MSYTILQSPDPYSLTSTIKDYLISSDEILNVKMQIADKVIINENYTPDSDSMIQILGIGQLIDNYLSGNLDIETTSLIQDTIFCKLSVLINGLEVDLISLLKCRSYTDIDATNFISGNLFLNVLQLKKITTPDAREYLTFYSVNTSTPFSVCITTLEAGSYIDSDFVNFESPEIDQQFVSVNVSFDRIANMFTDITPDTIVAYRIKRNDLFLIYAVDRTFYQKKLHFLYKNAFDVPESIITRGEVYLKGLPKFQTSKVNGVTIKYGINRADTFEVSSGKIFSAGDYDRFRELIDSNEVRLLWNGKYRQIVITEESSNVNQNIGKLQPISFTFMFADARLNNFILGESFRKWILAAGTWDDSGVWLDSGHWIDDPVD